MSSNPSTTIADLKLEEEEKHGDEKDFYFRSKDRSGNKTPLALRKKERRIKNKMAKKSKQINKAKKR